MASSRPPQRRPRGRDMNPRSSATRGCRPRPLQAGSPPRRSRPRRRTVSPRGDHSPRTHPLRGAVTARDGRCQGLAFGDQVERDGADKRPAPSSASTPMTLAGTRMPSATSPLRMSDDCAAAPSGMAMSTATPRVVHAPDAPSGPMLPTRASRGSGSAGWRRRPNAQCRRARRRPPRTNPIRSAHDPLCTAAHRSRWRTAGR